jgi:DNA-binding response OmpR family regulator
MQPEPVGGDVRYILVVDDDPAICDVLQMMLEDEGWVVETARRGSDAARTIRSRPPVLLILDLHLGSGDERDLIFDALAGAARPVPVLVVSGDADASYALRGILGVADYLPKPFDLDQLYTTVGRLIAEYPSPIGDRPASPRTATDRPAAAGRERPLTGGCIGASLSA